MAQHVECSNVPKTSIHKFLNLPIKINSEFYDTDMVDKENITMKMSGSISVYQKRKVVKIGQKSTEIKIENIGYKISYIVI